MRDERALAPAGPQYGTNLDTCPRCGAADTVTNLLTSMNRYLACVRCRHRWRLAGGPGMNGAANGGLR